VVRNVSTLADLLVHIGVDTRGVDQGTANIRRKFKDAFKSVSDGAKGIVPAVAGFGSLIPVALAGGAAVASLGATMAAAGIAAGVFGAVLGSSITEVKEQATKFEDLTDKIELYGKQARMLKASGQDNTKMLKKQADAMLELDARMKLLPPSQREAVRSFIGMKSAWQGFVDQNKPQTFGILARSYALIGKVVGKLQPFFDMGAAAAGRLVNVLGRSVDGGLLDRLATTAGPALETLTSIIINVGRAVARTFGNLGAKTGQGFLDWLDKATAKWAEWAGQSERGDGVAKMFQTLATQGPPLLSTLRDIASAAVHIAQAVAPLAPITLAVAGALAAIIAAVPPGVLTAIVAAWIAWGVALKAYAVYQAIATAAQWANNAAWLAWPGTWIIAAILILIGVIVLIATKTTWFQTIWDAVWGFMKRVGAWFAGPFANFFVQAWAKISASLVRAKGQFMSIIGFIKNLFIGWLNLHISVANKIISAFGKVVSFFKSARSRISGALSGMWDGLKNGFRAAINWVIGRWNSISFSVPSFTFLGKNFGGGTVGVPKIPQLADGGIVKASPGGTLVNVGEGGQDEAVVPLGRGAQSVDRAADRPIVLEIVPGGEADFRRWINKTIRVKGPLGGAPAVA
jgi:hypothetical protein